MKTILFPIAQFSGADIQHDGTQSWINGVWLMDSTWQRTTVNDSLTTTHAEGLKMKGRG